MHARVTKFQGDPAQVDEGIVYYREKVVPQARQLAGFAGALSLVDRETGKTLSMTLWETEDAMRASEVAADQMRSQGAQDLGLGTPTVERYEVAVDERPAGG